MVLEQHLVVGPAIYIPEKGWADLTPDEKVLYTGHKYTPKPAA